MSSDKQQFVDFCARNFTANKTSFTITHEKVGSVVDSLERPSGENPKFKHWIKKNNFCVVDLPSLGVNKALYVRSLSSSGEVSIR